MQLQVDHGPSLELKIGESGISSIYSERNMFGILFVCFIENCPGHLLSCSFSLDLRCEDGGLTRPYFNRVSWSTRKRSAKVGSA